MTNTEAIRRLREIAANLNERDPDQKRVFDKIMEMIVFIGTFKEDRRLNKLMVDEVDRGCR